MLSRIPYASRKVKLPFCLANSLQETTFLLLAPYWSSLPRLQPIIDAKGCVPCFEECANPQWKGGNPFEKAKTNRAAELV